MLDHKRISGFSTNDIYCLDKIGYQPGQLCLGNQVISVGAIGGMKSVYNTLAGGEVVQITELVSEARKQAYNRMLAEARHYGGIGVASVSINIAFHGMNIEFISFGNTIRSPNEDGNLHFSTSDNAKELYCQIDCGFKPHSFVFGNIAYSIGVGGGIKGYARSFLRGEVKEYTDIYNHTRHTALQRIKEEAIAVNANAIVGLRTTISYLLGAQEMAMIGTASSHPMLTAHSADPITSNLSNKELWSLVQIGYMPVSLVIGVSVYSLGLFRQIGAFFKNIAGGNIDQLTELLYEAREAALAKLEIDAEHYQADKVVGTEIFIYDLGGGLVEFMAIGTAVKKMDGITTKNKELPIQAVITEESTFIDSGLGNMLNLQTTSAKSVNSTQKGPGLVLSVIFGIIVFATISIFNLINLNHKDQDTRNVNNTEMPYNEYRR